MEDVVSPLVVLGVADAHVKAIPAGRFVDDEGGSVPDVRNLRDDDALVGEVVVAALQQVADGLLCYCLLYTSVEVARLDADDVGGAEVVVEKAVPLLGLGFFVLLLGGLLGVEVGLDLDDDLFLIRAERCV